MFSAVRKLLSPSFKTEAHNAYLKLVAASRQPWFYAEAHVTDTIDGRFDVLALHLFLLIHRLRSEESTDSAYFIRALSETFFADMDRSLREMGTGDTGVGIRVKNMAQAFYGRLHSYEQAMTNPTAFKESLTRNLYRGEAQEPKILIALWDYVERNVLHLASQKFVDILRGNVEFLR